MTPTPKLGLKANLNVVVDYEGEGWRANLAFRDALRRDADLRARYAREKLRAVAEAPGNRAVYNEIKGPFIAGVMAGLAE